MTLLAGIAVPATSYSHLADLPPGIVLAADTRFSRGTDAPDDDGLKVVPVGAHSIVGMRGDVRLVERALLQFGRIGELVSGAGQKVAPERLLRDLLRLSLAIEIQAVEDNEREGPVHASTAFLATQIPELRLWRLDSEQGFDPKQCDGLTAAGDGASQLVGPFEYELDNIMGGPHQAGYRLGGLGAVLAAAIQTVIASGAASTVGGSVTVAVLEPNSPPQFLSMWASENAGETFAPITSGPERLRSATEILGRSPLREAAFAPRVTQLGIVLDFGDRPEGGSWIKGLRSELVRATPFAVHGAVMITFEAPPVDMRVPVRYLWEGPDGAIPLFQPSRENLSPGLARRVRGPIKPGEVPALVTANVVDVRASQSKPDLILVRLDFPSPGGYRLRVIVDEQSGFETSFFVKELNVG